MSVLFPNISAFVMSFVEFFYLAGWSYFRVLAIMFENGVSYKWIILINIFLTIPVWLRTFFLFPVIRFKTGTNAFFRSFIGRMILSRKEKSAQRMSTWSEVNRERNIEKEKVKFKDVRKQCSDINYILMVVWIVQAALNLLFCVITWNSFTRLVAKDNYQKHVDDFGSYAWTAALFTLPCGFISDLLGKCIQSRPSQFGKILGAGIFVVLNLFVGITMNILQFEFNLSIDF